MAQHRLLKEANLPLEVVILVVAGMTMLITGGLLFPISTGALAYYEDGLYGLLLVIFAVQTITMGKTPFGDMRRSAPVFVAGSLIAAVGIVTCFVPDLLGDFPRILLIVCFGLGGFLLLINTLLAEGKVRTWLRYGGMFRHLIAATSLVYVLSMLIAVLLWRQQILTVSETAVAALVYGVAILYLAAVLHKVYGAYPQAQANAKQGELSTEQSLLLLTGLFMVLLGVLLVPVNLGALPFSGSAQLGLLMVIFAVQMLAAGSTPIGPFRRTWLMIALGLVFAALGVVSCIVDDVLVVALTAIIGALNIAGGVVTLAKVGAPFVKKSAESEGSVPPMLIKLFTVQGIMGVLTITFGLSMFASQLIPGLLLGVVLAANGAVLLYLLRLLIQMDRLHAVTGDSTAGAESGG